MDWAMPDLNQGAPKWTGQCRTSTRELQSGLGNAGPQPGSSNADWATPDLSRGPLNGLGTGGFQLPADMSEHMSEDMSEDISEKNVKR